MSGGSYDYVYMKIQDLADNFLAQRPVLRRTFGRHLRLIAEAMHDIEWVDSCDYGDGDEIAAINKVLGKDAKAAQISILKEDAEKLIEELKKLLAAPQVG